MEGFFRGEERAPTLAPSLSGAYATIIYNHYRFFHFPVRECTMSRNVAWQIPVPPAVTQRQVALREVDHPPLISRLSNPVIRLHNIMTSPCPWQCTRPWWRHYQTQWRHLHVIVHCLYLRIASKRHLPTDMYIKHVYLMIFSHPMKKVRMLKTVYLYTYIL